MIEKYTIPNKTRFIAKKKKKGGDEKYPLVVFLAFTIDSWL